MTYDDTAKFGLQGSKSQPNNGGALERKDAGTQKSAALPIVCITSYRCRLLDEDNLAGGCKPLLDSLRYAGLISGDSPKEIVFVPEQVKVAHRKEERTVVDIEYA